MLWGVSVSVACPGTARLSQLGGGTQLMARPSLHADGDTWVSLAFSAAHPECFHKPCTRPGIIPYV